MRVVAVKLVGLVLVGAALWGCGGTICDEAADVCAIAPETPDFLVGERECRGDRECLSQCIVNEDACEPTDIGHCEDLCAGNVGGGSP